jgi:chromosome segregation ATPase
MSNRWVTDKLDEAEQKITKLESQVERLFNLFYGLDEEMEEVLDAQIENTEAHKLLHRRIETRKQSIKNTDMRVDRLEIRQRDFDAPTWRTR